MRVFELAKQLDIPSKELIELIEMLEIPVKNHMSGLTDEQTAAVIEAATGAAPAVLPETTAAPPAPDTEELAQDPVSAVDAPAEPEAPAPEPAPVEEIDTSIKIYGPMVVKDLAEAMEMKPNVVIAQLMGMGVFASINQQIDQATAVKLAKAKGFEVRTEPPKPPPPPPPPEPEVHEEITAPGEGGQPQPVKVLKKKKKKKEKDEGSAEGEPRDTSLTTRPPVVTFLGHVDHGKTSLMDRIRKANVVAGEAGGITQHIGAYTVSVNGKEITFLDTPGHAAFSQMRARGANLTDIAVIVIAADEGIKPQTKEAIAHAQAAEVELMVAANKIDLPTANLENLKIQLQQAGLPTEDWGGSTVFCPVSAQTGAGLPELLDMILLQAEILELEARHDGPATGYVIEAQLEPGMGPTAHVLVTEGTLSVGDALVCGDHWGRIKALIDHNGKRVKQAGPSHAVKVLGLTDIPSPGDRFDVYANDLEARRISQEKLEERRLADLRGPARKLAMDDLFSKSSSAPEVEKLNILLKCDVRGSLEALTDALKEIVSDKVTLRIVNSGIGNISENDVLLASASNAVVIGFNVSTDNAAVKAAKREGVDIQLYDIIYELIDEVRAAMLGLLKPVVQERVTGHAEIRVLFKLNRGGNVAGSMVIDGRIRSTARARVFRGKDIIYKGAIASLKRFQDEVREVGNGQECGIRLENFNEFETGDVIEVYETELVAQKL